MARSNGETRQCPHCRATILASATVCPGCSHHLRFGPQAPAGAAKAAENVTAFRIEGAFNNGGSDAKREYSVIVAIKNDRGEVMARQVIGVGVVGPGDTRNVSLWVDMQPDAKRG
jgi:hypothetical protein